MILFVLKPGIKAGRQPSAGIWMGDGMGLLSDHRDAGSCFCASVEGKEEKYTSISSDFPVNTGKRDFFHPRGETSQALPSQQEGCAIPRAAAPLPHKQNMDNLAARAGFCFQSRWEGMPGSPGGATTNKLHHFNTVPIKQSQAQDLLGKSKGSLLSHLPGEEKENEPWKGETRELK